MATKEVTLNQLLDDAVETLPFVRRKIMQARMRNPRARAKVLDELQLSIYEDPRAASMGIQPAFGSASFTAETPFSIDIDNLERILKLIVEYLPQIIQLITALFGSVLLLIAFSASSAGAAELNPLAAAEIRFASLQAAEVAPAVPVVSAAIELAADCKCKSRGTCDCTDCQCENCPCKDAKSDTVDEMTGVPIEGDVVIMLSTPGCQPCEAWKLSDEPQVLKSQGYRVYVHSDTTKHVNVRSYPTFVVYRSGLRSIIEGPIKAVRRVITAPVRALAPAPIASAPIATVSYSAPVASPMPPSEPAFIGNRGNDWLIGGQPWSRQSLINHLATHSNHGHSVSQLQGMSLSQLNALHNADHEGRRPPMQSAAMSGCPNGNCPPSTSGSYRSRGLFGLFR